MSWFPIGPDFVYAPRDSTAPKRLSRRNEYARQSMVSALAVDPLNPSVIYTAENPHAENTFLLASSLWRTDNGGSSWVSLLDTLQQSDSTISATCIAVHPSSNNYVYLGTMSGAVYVSANRGQMWNPPQNLGSQVVQIVVDPRNAGNPATTVVYAATQNGLFRSADGGATWGATPVLAGRITWLSAYMPQAGTAHFYAGVYQSGVFHATDPTAGWTNLSTGGAGNLPAYNAAINNFDAILIDYCQQNPNRVYVWLTSFGRSVGLYTTGTAPSGWTNVNSPSLPDPGQLDYSLALAVAPNSPGNGTQDILLWASVGLYRSTDGGQNWVQAGDVSHGDQHAFGFAPVNPPPGMIPTVIVGCDGGTVASTGLADPMYNLAASPSDFSDGATYTASGLPQNLNHGKLAVGIQAYAANPSVSAVGYAASQDTELSAHSGALGWRGLDNATDGWGVACAPASDGMKVWVRTPFYGAVFTDNGGVASGGTAVLLNGTGPLLVTTSNHLATPDGHCVAAAQVKPNLTAPVGPGNGLWATPSSMAHITFGAMVLTLDGSNSEIFNVLATSATQFQANFTKAHGLNAPMRIYNAFIARIDANGAATEISADLGDPYPWLVAAGPSDPTLFACVTEDDRVFVTRGVVPGPSTVWAQATGNRPTIVPNQQHNPNLRSIAIDIDGNVYVLWGDLTPTLPGGAITTPLFQISGGNWVPQPSSGLPTERFGPMIADPIQHNTLYAASGGHVYQVVKRGTTWTWTDLSGLPGPRIMDLWIGNIGTAASPRVLLRASVATRGVFEREVTAGAVDPPTGPYLRNHFLDQGWLSPPPDSLVNPYNPAAGITVFHYQSPDIKIDAQQPGPPAFFQNEPEGSLPLSHVLFDQLVDNSQALPGSDTAMVHVQVRNRSFTKVDNLSVWAIYARAAGGVPSLSASPMMLNNFPFWSQFQAMGQIVPSLPMDSPWTSVGAPQSLSGIDAANPQVASWNWTIPTLPTGDPGHYCVAVFLHSGAYPINETGTSVDSITRSNRQIGQKNLHIGPPLHPSRHKLPPRGPRRMQEYVEFHNPTARARRVDLAFDLRRLPPQLQTWLRLTELKTAAPLDVSIVGAAPTRPSGSDSAKGALVETIELAEEAMHWLDGWLDRAERKLGGDDESSAAPRPAPLPRFAAPIYLAKPSTLVEVRGVHLGGFEWCAALLVIENQGELPAGSEYTFDVQQRIDGHVVGGSTYVVRIAGQRAPAKAADALLSTAK